MFSDALRPHGFTDSESQVYTTLLELGQAPASSVARRLGENRVTVYSTLKKLVNKWFVSESQKWGSTFYVALAPDKLFVKLQNKLTELQEVLPEMMAIQNKKGIKPKVQFYEGLEGIKTLYEDVIISSEEMEEGEPFLTFIGSGEIDQKLARWFEEEFIPRRITCPTPTRAILSADMGGYVNYNKKRHDAITIIDELPFDLGNEIIVYGRDKIAIIMYQSEEMMGLCISSPTLHLALKSMFNLIRRLYTAKYKTKQSDLKAVGTVSVRKDSTITKKKPLKTAVKSRSNTPVRTARKFDK